MTLDPVKVLDEKRADFVIDIITKATDVEPKTRFVLYWRNDEQQLRAQVFFTEIGPHVQRLCELRPQARIVTMMSEMGVVLR